MSHKDEVRAQALQHLGTLAANDWVSDGDAWEDACMDKVAAYAESR